MKRLNVACFIYLFGATSGFVPNNRVRKIQASRVADNEKPQLVVLESESRKDKDGGEGEMRNRRALVAESIAPFRGLRLFLYGALGSGAFVGGLINTSGAIAASNSPEFNLNTEVS